jgi:hypothetical protein
MTVSSVKRAGVAIAVVIASCSPSLAVGRPTASAMGRPPADLPLDHWAYPLLERLAGRGVIAIDLAARPIARSAVRAALLARSARSQAAARPVDLTDRERWALERLEAEFTENAVDRPTLARRDGDAVVAIGLKLGTEIRYSAVGAAGVESLAVARDLGDDDVRASADLSYELWGGVGDAVGFWSTATLLAEGQDGPRTERLSSRARTWRGFAATVDEAYLKLEGSHYGVAVGRRGSAWGTARWGRLLISGTAPTLDGIDASFRVGPLSFRGLHALLEYRSLGTEEHLAESDHVFLAAHRAAVDGGWGSVGVSEAVVYSATIPEPGYLVPLIPYYLAQHNEREDDNVLWSLDVLTRPLTDLDLYGEFLVDDLQYERDTGHPDKYGVTVGAAHYGNLLRSDVETSIEYTNVRKWTYTHGRVEHRFAQDGHPIGFDLGPDADRVTFGFVCHPSLKWSARLGLASARKGEGTIDVPFEDGENDEPAFPSGDVTTTRTASLDLLYDDPGRFSGGFGASYHDSERSDSAGGSGTDGNGWEIWAGVRFRI